MALNLYKFVYTPVLEWMRVLSCFVLFSFSFVWGFTFPFFDSNSNVCLFSFFCCCCSRCPIWFRYGVRIVQVTSLWRLSWGCFKCRPTILRLAAYFDVCLHAARESYNFFINTFVRGCCTSPSTLWLFFCSETIIISCLILHRVDVVDKAALTQ